MRDLDKEIENAFGSRLSRLSIERNNNSWDKIAHRTSKPPSAMRKVFKSKYFYPGIFAIAGAAAAAPFVPQIEEMEFGFVSEIFSETPRKNTNKEVSQLPQTKIEPILDTSSLLLLNDSLEFASEMIDENPDNETIITKEDQPDTFKKPNASLTESHNNKIIASNREDVFDKAPLIKKDSVSLVRNKIVEAATNITEENKQTPEKQLVYVKPAEKVVKKDTVVNVVKKRIRKRR